MQIEKSFVVQAPRAAVWDFLTDPHKVAKCLPGAAVTEQVDETTYAGTITVKVGPVTASYRGKLKFERLDEAAGEAELQASGQETRGKGGAEMRMKSRVAELAPGETEVRVTSEVNVFGVLAQMGRGMIQDVSDQLFQKFSDAMRRELAVPAASEAPAPASAVGSASGAGGPSAAAAPVASPASAPTPPAEASAVAPLDIGSPLDLGKLGAAAAGRAVGRGLSRPGFWVALVILALVLYWLLR